MKMVLGKQMQLDDIKSPNSLEVKSGQKKEKHNPVKNKPDLLEYNIAGNQKLSMIGRLRAVAARCYNIKACCKLTS